MDAVLPKDPSQLLTPLLWEESQIRELLRGSPVLEEALARRAAIAAEWAALQAEAPDLLPPGRWPCTCSSLVLVQLRNVDRWLPDKCRVIHDVCCTSYEHHAEAWTEARFAVAVAAVLASAVYLPSAECLALVPGVSTLRRTGTSAGCLVDYDLESGQVVLTAQGPIKYVQESIEKLC